MKEISQDKKERNTGLDLLRIISMIMILILHYLGKGGLLEVENASKNFLVLYWFLEVLSIVAVNCYVLISGYFLVKSEFKMKKLLRLWGQVVFYSIAIYVIMLFLGLINFNMKDAIKSCFPILTQKYWFVNSYFALYLLSPFLNKLINALNKKEYKTLLIILIILFSVMSILPSEMVLDKTGGHGIIWFICLYIIAGYIRLHSDKEKIKKYKNKCLLIYFISAILLTIGVFLIKYICSIVNIKDFSQKLLQYNNFLVLIQSVCLFLYFNSIQIRSEILKKLILFIAPLTFAVYIIHEHATVKTILYTKILNTDICYRNPYGFFIIIGSVLILFSICIVIESIRKNISKKLFKNWNMKHIIEEQKKEKGNI